MSAIAALKLSNTRKPSQQPAIVQQRTKLAKRILEQMQLARAQQTGTTFASKRMKSVVGADGVKQTIEVAKRVKAWWFVADTGKLCLNIRYGSKLIELVNGKTTVEVASADELIAALNIVKTAVLAGELDAQIKTASGQLRAGFKQ